MIQPSKSGGMGAAFGGIGEAFGGKAGSHLTKTTVIMTAIFFIVALALAAFIGHGGGKKEASDEFSKALTAQEEVTVKAPEAKAGAVENKAK
jgi:preprotein translocase subunit SecG